MNLFFFILRLLRFLKRNIIVSIVRRVKYFDFLRDAQNPTQPITFDYWVNQKIYSINKSAYWPVHRTSRVTGVQNILVGKGSFPGYMPGCYIQGIGKVIIGRYALFAPNVGIISSNHNIYDTSKHDNYEVIIGDYAWIGMNSVILPGVVLGAFTVVAAGAIVTKSFPEGYCVIAGNPAVLIKKLEIDKCVHFENKDSKYRGYVPDCEFEEFVRKNLNNELLKYL